MHITMAQEIIRDINRKVSGGNVVFKIDMAKAYDRLEWRFLPRTIKAFGFLGGACDLIYRNICNIRISGESVGNFLSFRGVHQGDPLSHLLFVLAQQVISTNLKLLIEQGLVALYEMGRNNLLISPIS